TYEAAAASGFDHVFGVANQSSTPGFIRSLGFQLVSPLDLRVITAWPGLDDCSETTAWRREWGNVTLRWRLAHPQFHYRNYQRGGFTFYLLHRRGVQTVVKIERSAAEGRSGLLGLSIPRV